ncbi:MAG: PAQR family membrane homeostasis protein TrhA [Limnochordia bacterium]
MWRRVHIRIKDPISGYTHLGGMLLAMAGLVLLILKAVQLGTAWHVVSFTIFGGSMVLLYAASAFYHLLSLSPRGDYIMRRIDHMMIYLLIAGSYAPFCLVALRGAWGWSMFGFIWTTAIVGMVVNFFWTKAPRWLYTLLYAVMGWAVVIATRPLLQALPAGGFVWLLTGGLFYTVGAVIYAVKWPKLKPGVFGFHELWHLFVLAGTMSHFWAVYRYVAELP